MDNMFDRLRLCKPELIVEAIEEAFHNNLDGIDSEAEKETIKSFVQDCIVYAEQARS